MSEPDDALRHGVLLRDGGQAMTLANEGGETMLSIPSRFQISEVMKGDHHFVDPSLGTAVDHLFYFRIDFEND